MIRPIQIDHEERNDRRLAAVLSLTREENYRRTGSSVSPAQSQAWAMVQDPGVHTFNNCNVRRLMTGGSGGD